MHRRWIDDAARMMAIGRSRREVLRYLGGLVGVLAAGAPSAVVEAASPSTGGGGNHVFARWCNEIFPAGRDRGKCKKAAARGEGPCYECGPHAPSGSTRVLCGQICCGPEQTCVDGRCSCSAGNACGELCCRPTEFFDCCDNRLCCNGSCCEGKCCRPYSFCCAGKCCPGRGASECCGGECCYTATGPGGGQLCVNGRCVCPTGFERCGTSCCGPEQECVFLGTNTLVCRCPEGRGVCGHPYPICCQPGQQCVGEYPNRRCE